MNKPELKTVYIPVNEYKDYTVSYKMEEGACDYVNKQQLITFTPEEYNNHIKDIIKETLDNAVDKGKILLKDYYSEDYKLVESEVVMYNSIGVNNVYPEDCNKYTVSINKESITNTLEETFNKLKYE